MQKNGDVALELTRERGGREMASYTNQDMEICDSR
jgi:hypothetical protein